MQLTHTLYVWPTKYERRQEKRFFFFSPAPLPLPSETPKKAFLDVERGKKHPWANNNIDSFAARCFMNSTVPELYISIFYTEGPREKEDDAAKRDLVRLMAQRNKGAHAWASCQGQSFRGAVELELWR